MEGKVKRLLSHGTLKTIFLRVMPIQVGVDDVRGQIQLWVAADTYRGECLRGAWYRLNIPDPKQLS